MYDYNSLPKAFALFLFPLIFWSLFWKGTSLWTAARHSQKNWFIALLIFNTAGLLDILYLSLFQKQPTSKPKKSSPKRKSA